MRARALLFWLSIFALGTSCLGADATKVGYIDSGRVLDEYLGAGDLVRQFDKEMAAWKEEATKRRGEIDKLLSELKSQELMLSEEARANKRAEIEKKEADYQAFVQEIWGTEGKAVTRRNELTKPVVEKIDNILEKLGSEQGYTMIFDIAGGSVVYAKEGLDLTDMVLDELNKEFAPAGERKEKIKFIVFEFEEQTREATELRLGKKIPDLLKAALPKAGRFEKISDSRVAMELRNEGVERAEDIDIHIASTIGEIVGAEAVFIGKVSKLGEKIDVVVDMIEVVTRNSIGTEPASSGDEDEEMETMAGDLASRLVGRWRF